MEFMLSWDLTLQGMEIGVWSFSVISDFILALWLADDPEETAAEWGQAPQFSTIYHA